MAPKKKKQPKNAFYFFMKDFKDDQEQKGIRFPNGMKDVAEAANPAWKLLSMEDRLYYEDLAAESKLKDKTNLENKYTTTGISYAQLEREDRERRRQELTMQLDIEGTVRALDREKALPFKVFHFIHFNYYCRLENGTYIICEVALAEFNLFEGVLDTYHAIISQERIPLGYTYESSKTSEETHRIPLPPLEMGEKYSGELFKRIKQFLQRRNTGKKLPPVYTLSSYVEVAQSSLTALTELYLAEKRKRANSTNSQANANNPSGQNSKSENPVDTDNDDAYIFSVYPLNNLFFELRNACAPDSRLGFPVMHLADRELDKDQYNFAPGISCHMHERTDACVYCSLSVVQRWVFLICDHCCKDLGIEITPGKHVPINAAVKKVEDKKKKSPEQRTNREAPSASSTPPRLVAPPPVRLIDHSKLGPSEEDASHFNISISALPASNMAPVAQPGPSSNSSSTVSVGSRPGTSGTCWGLKRDEVPSITPLRLPKSSSTSGENSLKFTDDDFPAIGSSSATRVPVMVAGRGRGKVMEKNYHSDGPSSGASSKGRGRGKEGTGPAGDGASRQPALIAGRGRSRQGIGVPKDVKPGSRSASGSGSSSASGSETQ